MRERTRILCVVIALGATVPCLAQTPEPFEVRRAEAVFEELPELNASEILKPELLKGPHYVVRDPVPTGSGMNQFTIDSDFGVFEADGNEMLLQRLKEIDAIARLQDVSRTDEFKKSLVTAAKSPLNPAKNIARDPAQAISNVPKGVMIPPVSSAASMKPLIWRGSASQPNATTCLGLSGCCCCA